MLDDSSAINEFLNDIDSKTRRMVLAQHQLYCRDERRRYYKELEKEKAESERKQSCILGIKTDLLLPSSPEDIQDACESRIADLHARKGSRKQPKAAASTTQKDLIPTCAHPVSFDDDEDQCETEPIKPLFGSSMESCADPLVPRLAAVNVSASDDEVSVDSDLIHLLAEIREDEDPSISTKQYSSTSIAMSASKIIPPTKAHKKRKRSRIHVKTEPGQKSTTHPNIMSVMSIVEIRSTIYQKYITTFQTFYNEHDVMRMLSMLMYPCCCPNMVREMNLWVSTTTPVTVPVTLPDGSCSEGTVLRKHMHMIKSRQFHGRDAFQDDCVDILEKLPDCLIFYEPTKVRRPLNDHGLTMVTADYSYLFTVPVRVKNEQKQPLPFAAVANLTSTSPHVPRPTKTTKKLSTPPTPSPSDCSVVMVQVEVIGCNILYFNNYGMVEKKVDHIALKSVSDPNISVTQLIEFIGMNN